MRILNPNLMNKLSNGFAVLALLLIISSTDKKKEEAIRKVEKN